MMDIYFKKSRTYFLCLSIGIIGFIQSLSAQQITPDINHPNDPTDIGNVFLQQLAVFPQEKIYVHTDKSVYVTGETMWMKIYLVDAVFMQQANASRYVYVELLSPLNEVTQCAMIRPDSLGHFYGHMLIDETLSEGEYTLRAYTQYMRNLGEEYFFSRAIRVLDPYSAYTGSTESEEGFDVSFFPEGGHALCATDIQLAFKATNKTGRSEWVTGEVYDDTGNLFGTFESEHLGMGSFRMYYQPGRTYHAVCTNRNNISQRFDLPRPQPEGCALKVIRGRNDIRVAVNRTSDYSLPTNTRLIAHIRGVVLYAERWDDAKGYVIFDPDFFPAGIVHLLLIDGERNILSERLFFSSQRSSLAKVEVAPDKQNYNAREKIVLNIAVEDDQGKPLSGNLSLSVVDRQDVAADSAVSILSIFLLTSELKGHIELPMSYLKLDDRKAIRALDVLMMTHGWRRYCVPSLLKGELTYPTPFPVETSQSISGKSSGVFSSTHAGQVSLIAIRDSVLGTLISQTDKDGRFEFRDFEFPDSTWYIVQALTKKGSQRTFISLDKKHSSPEATLPPIWRAGRDAWPTLNEYRKKSNDKYTIEHGMRIINLAEVEIVGSAVRKKRVNTSSPYYSVSTSKVITADEINRNKTMQSVFDLLRLLPGVTVSGEEVRYRQQSPLLILDNIPMEQYDYSNIQVDDVDDAFVARAESVMPVFGTRAANGAIVINTKKGVLERNTMNKNIQTLRPIGYQQSVEFYSPTYETESARQTSTPDFRTTIYWKPDIYIDGTGKARVTFYAADSSTTYSIVVEGVSQAGHLIYSADQIISRKQAQE